MPEPLNAHYLDPGDPHNLQRSENRMLERIEIATQGEDCNECVRKLRPVLMKVPGVVDVVVDRPIVKFDVRKTHVPDLQEAILQSGYKPAPRAELIVRPSWNRARDLLAGARNAQVAGECQSLNCAPSLACPNKMPKPVALNQRWRARGTITATSFPVF